MAKVKGSIYTQANLWVDEQLGPGAFARAIVAGGGVAGEAMPSSWYPAEPLLRALTTVGAARGLSPEEAVAAVARLNAKNDLTTIYRIFLRIAAPVRVLGQSPRLWSVYMDFARPTVERNDPGWFVGSIAGVPSHLLDLVCGACRGFLPTAVEMAGGKSATLRILERDPARTVFEVRYR